ncbi:MAG: cytosine deaminase [Lachnospiraceae bacterium]|nr:cytosine deaminase [Lachnospiraceae bacterium]
MKLYKNARLRHKQGLFDIWVDGNVVADILPAGSLKGEAEEYDVSERLVCEPYVESHIHLDYIHTADIPDEKTDSGTLFEAIDKWSDSKKILTVQDIKERAYKGILAEMRNGVQYIRTHVDVTDNNLTALKAMLEVKEEVKDKLYLQIIAFPQEGYYAYKGGDKLVEEALKMGADVVGGIPHFEFTKELGEKSVKKAFELAMKYDKLVDIHCDETDDTESRFVENIAAEAYYTGIGSRATASHTCAMSSYNNAYAFKMMSKFKKSGINFVSCPTENCYLQGRYDGYPRRRGITRVDELVATGCNVSFAQDSISDPWYPLGNGNLIHQVDFGLHLGHMMSIEQIQSGLDFITINGAKTLSLADGYELKKGNKASFIVLDAPSEIEAIRQRAHVILSVHEGKTIMEKKPEEILVDIL